MCLKSAYLGWEYQPTGCQEIGPGLACCLPGIADAADEESCPEVGCYPLLPLLGNPLLCNHYRLEGRDNKVNLACTFHKPNKQSRTLYADKL